MPASISNAVFRESLAHFASGVTVVTTRTPGGPVGFTATAFSSVSLDPPLILLCIGKSASAYEAIFAAERFGVNVLAEQQAWVAEQFARRDIDRFAGVRLSDDAASNPPLVHGAIVQLVCRHHARFEAGDHTILVGEVLEAEVASGRPLVHFARRFAGVTTEPLAREAPSRAAESEPAGGEA